MKIEDLDLEIDELELQEDSGEVITVEDPTPAIPMTEEEAMMDRMRKICDQKKTWLSIPVRNEDGFVLGEYTREISECSGEEFVQWLNRYLPASVNFKHSPTDYETLDARVKVVNFVVDVHEICWKHPIKIEDKI